MSSLQTNTPTFELLCKKFGPPPFPANIPKIRQLCEKLGYQSAEKLTRDLRGTTQVWRKQYVTPSHKAGTELRNWKCESERNELLQMAMKYLDDGNGERFWPNGEGDERLQYPKDQEKISWILAQLFWRQNYYDSHNAENSQRREIRKRKRGPDQEGSNNSSQYLETSSRASAEPSKSGNTDSLQLGRPRTELKSHVEVIFWIIKAREPRLDCERWRDGRLRGKSLSFFLEGASEITKGGRDRIEELKCTLQTFEKKITDTIRRDDTKAFESMKSHFIREIMLTWEEHRNGKQDFEIWVEPIFIKDASVDGENIDGENIGLGDF